MNTVDDLKEAEVNNMGSVETKAAELEGEEDIYINSTEDEDKDINDIASQEDIYSVKANDFEDQREYIVKNQNFKENMKIMEKFYEKLANGDVNL